ncbi:hypothetical protein CCACVL1_15179 [Corchorus capsularis]|uniref:F-box domain-containing protein n=1 Tax=Corchorus capsularis TaxID=210143 RepID=A0A1R3I3K1_COCAP|nr:hypothetical protein CCACVL1_15179 [Corchorus capsularis]
MAEMEKIKKAKKNHGEDEMAEMDRLTDLPDGILLHILSFLMDFSYRRCVQTTLLSKRWNNLWTSVPDLICHRGESKNVPSFKKFVRHVFSRRQNLPLNKLSLDYYGKDKSFITTIINYAISHNVQHFSLYAQLASLASLLPLFNTSGSLKTLKLKSFSDLYLLEGFTLPNLTSLCLDQCSFWNSVDCEPTSIDPFVGLFNLKSLQLLRFSAGRRVTNFKISGPQLHSLTITGHYQYKLEIIAPKLQFLGLESFHLSEFSDLDLPLLEIAELLEIGVALRLPHPRPPIDMFRRLYNAEALVLSSDMIMLRRLKAGETEKVPVLFVSSSNLPVREMSTGTMDRAIINLSFHCHVTLLRSHLDSYSSIRFHADVKCISFVIEKAIGSVDLLRGELQQLRNVMIISVLLQFEFVFWITLPSWKSQNSPLLEIAELAELTKPTEFYDYPSPYPRPLMDVFRGLYNAEALVLSSDVIQLLMEYPAYVLEDQSSPFVRLTTMKVKCAARFKDFRLKRNLLVYRLYQLTRATHFMQSLMILMKDSPRRPEVMEKASAIIGMVLTFQVLGVVCLWSFVTFLLRLFPSRPVAENY